MAKRSRDASPHEPEPAGRDAPVLPDHEILDESEAREAVWTRLREIGGNAFDRVRVDLVHGKIVLSGEIANESLRSIAEQVIADVAALPLGADHMRVTVGWETSERAPPPAPSRPPEVDRAEGIEDFNEDPFKSADQGAHWEPPITPVPEKD